MRGICARPRVRVVGVAEGTGGIEIRLGTLHQAPTDLAPSYETHSRPVGLTKPWSRHRDSGVVTVNLSRRRRRAGRSLCPPRDHLDARRRVLGWARRPGCSIRSWGPKGMTIGRSSARHRQPPPISTARTVAATSADHMAGFSGFPRPMATLNSRRCTIWLYQSRRPREALDMWPYPRGRSLLNRLTLSVTAGSFHAPAPTWLLAILGAGRLACTPHQAAISEHGYLQGFGQWIGWGWRWGDFVVAQ